MNTATKIAVSIGSIAVIATAGIGGLLLATSNDTIPATTPISSSVTPTTTSTSSTSSSTSDTSSSSSTTSSSTATYKDGAYTASATYSVPHGGSNSISATVTVAGGNITAVTTHDNYTDGESAMYIDSFESRVSSTVVGTSLADASFSRIGGASLTTVGFNNVLDTIRSQATA